MRPHDALNPKMPSNEAGIRIDPPPSVPMWSGPRPAAAAAEAPPLEPPGDRSSAQGLRVAPSSFGVEGHVGVDLRIDLLDAGEDGVHHLDGRDFLPPDQRGQLGTGQPAQVVGHDYLPRSRGSSVSRSASPSRFDPKTARLMAMPGKSTSQGAFWANSAADTESMRPHDG